MKIKAFLFLIAFSFIAQILLAQKSGFLFHTITIKLPQFAGLSLSSDPNHSTTIKKRKQKVYQLKKSNLWLNYHSILTETSTEPSKNIKAQITNGSLKEGLTLSLITSKDIGKGTGDIGKAISNPIILAKSEALKIIDNIGIAYTGKEAYEGHQLTYALSSKNRNQLQSNKVLSSNLTVTFTLFDN